jgi:hypothetical protein
MRIKISRKEAKETRYWLRLLFTGDDPELMNIFGAILRKC